MSAKKLKQEPVTVITNDMAEVLYLLDRGNTVTNIYLAPIGPDIEPQFCVSLKGNEFVPKSGAYHNPYAYVDHTCDFSRLPIAFAAITRFIEEMSEEDRLANGLLS